MRLIVGGAATTGSLLLLQVILPCQLVGAALIGVASTVRNEGSPPVHNCSFVCCCRREHMLSPRWRDPTPAHRLTSCLPPCVQVVVGPGMALLARLPLSTRTDLLAAVAAVLPYYSDPRRMHDLIACLPSPTATVVVRTVEEEAEEESEQPVQGQGQGHRPSSPGLMWSSPPGAGADFLIGEVSDTLGKIRWVAGGAPGQGVVID